MLTCLVLLATTFFLITIYSIVQVNLDLFGIAPAKWLSVKILDTSTAATLFVTSLGALVVRHQFVHSILPRINYTSEITTRQDFRNSNISFETWRVVMRNTGLGSAIIYRTDYLFEDTDNRSIVSNKPFQEIIDAFAKRDLKLGIDFWLGNISSGFSLSPKDEFILFEIKTEQREKLKRFNLTVYFHGQLGDKYRREIFLTPRM